MTDISWVVLPTAADVARAAAEAFVNAATSAAAEGGRFHVALPGGRTPLPAFALLAEPPLRDRVPWERVEVFWADERAVGFRVGSDRLLPGRYRVVVEREENGSWIADREFTLNVDAAQR